MQTHLHVRGNCARGEVDVVPICPDFPDRRVRAAWLTHAETKLAFHSPAQRGDHAKGRRREPRSRPFHRPAPLAVTVNPYCPTAFPSISSSTDHAPASMISGPSRVWVFQRKAPSPPGWIASWNRLTSAPLGAFQRDSIATGAFGLLMA